MACLVWPNSQTEIEKIGLTCHSFEEALAPDYSEIQPKKQKSLLRKESRLKSADSK